MDLEILKKKISTFRGDGGRVKNVSDEVLMEILLAWENWTGSMKRFASALGMHRTSLPKLIGKAKRLKREGHFPVEEFKEIKVSEFPAAPLCQGIEIVWDKGKVIRFQHVEQLVEFLNKSA